MGTRIRRRRPTRREKIKKSKEKKLDSPVKPGNDGLGNEAVAVKGGRDG